MVKQGEVIQSESGCSLIYRQKNSEKPFTVDFQEMVEDPDPVAIEYKGR
jgi:hypothetical protein